MALFEGLGNLFIIYPKYNVLFILHCRFCYIHFLYPLGYLCTFQTDVTRGKLFSIYILFNLVGQYSSLGNVSE